MATIRYNFTEAVVTYEEKPREQWIFDPPAQVRQLQYAVTIRCGAKCAIKIQKKYAKEIKLSLLFTYTYSIGVTKCHLSAM